MCVLMIVVYLMVVAAGIMTIHVSENHKSIFMSMMGWSLILMGVISLLITMYNGIQR